LDCNLLKLLDDAVGGVKVLEKFCNNLHWSEEETGILTAGTGGSPWEGLCFSRN
jgi:hypothetical protein